MPNRCALFSRHRSVVSNTIRRFNAVLYDFAVRIQALLGSHFCRMYLYGSLALGDFDPYTIGIDFLVVTDTELHESGEAMEGDMDDTIALIQHTAERIEH